MSKKDHPVADQLKQEAHKKVPKSDQNALAQTPKNPREQGQGHQRQPKP